MPKESLQIVVELLFPQGVNKEEMVTFVTTKIVKIIFDIFSLDDVKGLTPGVFIAAFNNFKNIQEIKLEVFVKGLNELLTHIKQYYPTQEIDIFLPILSMICSINKEQPDHWKIKEDSLNLLSSAVVFLAKEGTNINELAAVQEFIKFLSLVSSGHEGLADANTKKPLEPQDVMKMITGFCNSIGFNKDFYKSRNLKDESFIPTMIYLVLAFVRQETYELPREVLKSLEAMFELRSIGKNDFVSYCFNIANVIFNDSTHFFDRLSKCISSFGINDDLQDFCKMIVCYSLDEYETYSTCNIEDNSYFQKVTEKLKIRPDELLGLLDLICNKKSSKHINASLIAIMKRMGLKKDRLNVIRPIIDLFFSQDESVLLNAVKDLNLELGQFLLVGKHVLNPEFIPRQDYQDLGVVDADLLKNKNTIFGATDDTYEYWKGELRKNITDTLTKTREEVSDPESAEKYLVLENRANLAKSYLCDWNNFTFSKKNIVSFITALDNSDNNLKKKLSKYDKGASNNGIDFLVTIMNIQILALQKGKRYNRLDKEKRAAVASLAEYLSVSSEDLKNIIQIFVLSNQQDVLDCFFAFFPDEKENQEVYNRILSSSFKLVNIISSQAEFVTKKLPDSFETNLKLPPGVFSKILFQNNSTLSINDLLELNNLTIRKILKPQQREDLLKGCYTAGLFAKGLLSDKDMASALKVKDKQLLAVFDVLTEPGLAARLGSITGLFRDKEKGKPHPVKVITAFYGLFAQETFSVRNFQIDHDDSSDEGVKNYKEESIKVYLANILNVYPEVFDLFELAFERNLAKFVEKALPMMRRINRSSLIDVSLMESLFSLLFGEHFNASYLANRLDMSPDFIDFFISISRLAMKSTRRKELQDLPTLTTVRGVLARLKVSTSEIIALYRLVFNQLENDAVVTETITNLGLRRTATKGSRADENIDIELFKGLVTLNKSTDPNVDMFKNKAVLTSLKAKTLNFFSSVGLSTHVDNAFIISKIAAGNYLIIHEQKQMLDWVFPNDDDEAEVALRDLAMALCGLLNPNIDVPDELNKEVHVFVKSFYPKDLANFRFKEIEHKPDDEVLPNNSLSYAVYLAYYTIDITPFWSQIFLLDPKILSVLKKRAPDLKDEFIITIVLNFIHMPDIMRDFLGLYEWNAHCQKFYNEATQSSKPASGVFRDNKELYKFFFDKITFDYDQVMEFANTSGLLQDDHWGGYFSSSKNFYMSINQSLTYLLTLDKSIQEKKDLMIKISEFKKKPSNSFLADLIGLLEPSSALENFDDRRVIIGKSIEKVIIECYKITTLKLEKKPQRIPGFELTNLCILGTIISLRTNAKVNMSYDRTLFNLNQLTTNIERKMFLDDSFYKLSKFKLIKLSGISLGMTLSNLVEWCLPESLFTHGTTLSFF